ncbi:MULTISPECIES: hypothetical protein [Streptomyces]|uniref:Uncharacterized protein n=1 Tax=Streptomyces dengpaensis TaxID=2049881 RepID=A0ABN5HZ29_9ACTN|nr:MULTISPECIES: hypothetical protein [Streptomyces]AVH55801.1 hypothetical protein C4B68_08495 [Streptomyces dengpaensis]PIB12056.1 hypothetical protein B1C81_02430 [Streptomyces sp. HG99]
MEPPDARPRPQPLLVPSSDLVVRPEDVAAAPPFPDGWSQPAPIHLAQFPDDPSEPHILRGLD